MLTRIMKQRKGDGGFTLIELLIVVVVLGILAGVVVFGISTFRGDSVSSACKTDMGSVNTAAAAYNTKTGAYPAPLAGTTYPADSDSRIAVLVAASYLQSAPPTTDYVVTLAPAGVVTGVKTAANGGGAC